MASPQRWRICTVNAHEVHNPYIMKPSTQDVYFGKSRVFASAMVKKYFKEVATIVQSVAQNVEHKERHIGI